MPVFLRAHLRWMITGCLDSGEGVAMLQTANLPRRQPDVTLVMEAGSSSHVFGVGNLSAKLSLVWQRCTHALRRNRSCGYDQVPLMI